MDICVAVFLSEQLESSCSCVFTVFDSGKSRIGGDSGVVWVLGSDQGQEDS